jgi:hypothetical protein
MKFCFTPYADMSVERLGIDPTFFSQPYELL